MAPHTTSSRIVSKSDLEGHGGRVERTVGWCKINNGAKQLQEFQRRVRRACSSTETARTDTYPYIEIDEKSATVGHEATVSKVGDEQLFYLMSRGMDEAEAMALIVRGFIEPIAKELPLEYAVELNRLIELEMEGSVG